MTTKPPKPTSSDTLEQLREAARHCVKCGRCLTVCPVYKETGRETEAARGKLALIEAIAAGTVSLSEEKVKDILSYCLLCGACAESCPNLVAADEIIQAGREAFLSEQKPHESTETCTRSPSSPSEKNGSAPSAGENGSAAIAEKHSSGKRPAPAVSNRKGQYKATHPPVRRRVTSQNSQ